MDRTMQRRLAAWVGILAIAATACSDDYPGDPDPLKVDVETSPDPKGRGDSLIDFGDTLVDKHVNTHITIRNDEVEPVTVEVRGLDSPFGTTYRVSTLKVRPEGFLTVPLTFEPKSAGAAAAQVVVEARLGDRSKQIPLLLVGNGIEPSFHCDPGPVDFGQVSRAFERTLSWRCENRTKMKIPVRLEGAWLEVFDARISPTGGGMVRAWEVRAREAIDVAVSYRPNVSGPSQADLALVDSDGVPLAAVELRGVAVESDLLVEPEGCLDFGDVSFDQSAERTLTLTNTVGFSQNITVIPPPGFEAEFTVTPPDTFFLDPFELRSLTVAFRPRHPGVRTTTMSIDRRWDLPIPLCVRGVAHGPHLSCTGATIFPETVAGFSRTQRLRCTSDGYFRDDEIQHALQVNAVRTTNASFRASVVGGVRPGGYSIGESFDLDVTFAPGAGGVHEGVVSILTASAPGGSLDLAVSGSAVALPPCKVEIAPQFIDFGIVAPGRKSMVLVGIENRSDGPCRLMGVRLSDDSDPSFSLGASGDLAIPAGMSLDIPVHFAAPAEGGYEAARVLFDVSDPRDPHREIPIEATSEVPCLSFEPASIDFQAVGIGCASPGREVKIHACPGSTIESIDIAAGPSAESFYLSGKPNLPVTPSDDEPVSFDIGFSPRREWAIASGAVIVRDGQGVHRLPLVGRESLIRTDEFVAGASASSFALSIPAADLNGDGEVTELDLEVRVDGRLTPPVDENHRRVWTYDPASTSIRFEPPFALPSGANVRITYKSTCLPRPADLR